MKKKLLKISLVGRTNAGKSTLINNFVGEVISISNKKINTTEDLIEGVVNIKNTQLVFYDTPGLNFIKDINRKNFKLKINLWEGMNKSDFIMYIIDSKYIKINDIKNYIKKIKELEKKIVIIFNKIDLVEKETILPIIKNLNNLFQIESFFLLSAKTRTGLEKLIKYLIKNSYNSEWNYNNNEISNKNEIYISNECTRSVILSLIHKEIPYNLKKTNLKFKFLKNGDLKIKQNIEIDNIRYKKILLGKNGSKIKEIRVKSQNFISKIMKCKIHLYINIVHKNA